MVRNFWISHRASSRVDTACMRVLVFAKRGLSFENGHVLHTMCYEAR
jgi:hypothetical protein